MAGPAGGGLGPPALLLGQVGDGLGKAEQHPAAEAAPLGPGAAGGAAGLPGPGNQAARQQQQRQPTDQEQAVRQTLGGSAHFQFDKGRFSARQRLNHMISCRFCWRMSASCSCAALALALAAGALRSNTLRFVRSDGRRRRRQVTHGALAPRP